MCDGHGKYLRFLYDKKYIIIGNDMNKNCFTLENPYRYYLRRFL